MRGAGDDVRIRERRVADPHPHQRVLLDHGVGGDAGGAGMRFWPGTYTQAPDVS